MATDPILGLLLKYHRVLTGMFGFFAMEKSYLLNEREIFGITGYQDPLSQLRVLKQMGIETWIDNCGLVEVVRSVAEWVLEPTGVEDEKYVLPHLSWASR